MSQNKTIPTDNSVQEYIDGIGDSQRREDCIQIKQLMESLTGRAPVMWGSSIVGFGTYHYKYESGREGDMLITGFSNRANAITCYITTGFTRYNDLMENLGKYKTGKSCLYIKKLEDVDINVLSELISESVKAVEKKYEIIN